ncbi:hypothetical protein ACJX0J_030025, partial [Zea mays]
NDLSEKKMLVTVDFNIKICAFSWRGRELTLYGDMSLDENIYKRFIFVLACQEIMLPHP